MDAAEITLLCLNGTFGIVGGVGLARMFVTLAATEAVLLKVFVILLTVYFAECVAFMASMGTGVLGVALALIWGGALGVRFRGSPLDQAAISRLAMMFALYTCLPAMTFLSVPVLCALSGWSITSAEAGARFGIPGFVPSPLNTILGFCVAVSLVSAILKIGITTGVVRILTRAARRRPMGAA